MKEKRQQNLWLPALRAAFPYTVPIFAGFWFMGLAYGLLMSKEGFAFYWPMLMAMTVFSGSVEFVAVKLLLGPFNLVQSFVISLFICARHLFYGISMLDRFRGMGWKKIPLIYGMCDETFSINYTTRVPDGVDRGLFMLWVTILDYTYWVTGAALGGLIGPILSFNTKGLDFVMTAMFVVIYVEQWMKEKNHWGSVLGLCLSVVFLLIFGKDRFVVPTMFAMLVCFMGLRQKIEIKEDKQ